MKSINCCHCFTLFSISFVIYTLIYTDCSLWQPMGAAALRNFRGIIPLIEGCLGVLYCMERTSRPKMLHITKAHELWHKGNVLFVASLIGNCYLY
ncbi:hypothetical protein GDO78_012898 [Eleutherodactylus coqui]|uniref:Uncharacterized protein n=1 Tax=Eleutherodactylus coqui TaxID=57060 RepID=A0A8J6K3P5_ELECQ|nr:hypothetical protein GDO78_012898 [Eleutherodactylus coqui]